ncbi:MAG: imelysin family protein [Polyangiales bacterium]
MRRLPPTLALLCLAAACGSDDSGDKVPAALTDKALVDYEQVVNRNYDAVLSSAIALQAAVDAFVAVPSQGSQDAAKAAWIAARLPYGPSEAFRFYDGPIDNPETGREGLINAWPLDENYIDYTRDAPTAGIVNDPSKTIDATTLANLNEAGGAEGGEASISTGYHAIEFLLWGQDDAIPGMGAGKRTFNDYLTAPNAGRRGTYLKTVAQQLVDNLRAVADQWKPGATYATAFTKDRNESLSNLLRSIGSMAKAELSGERMTVAYVNRSEEDEHSCFSDNTAVDLLGNGLGIQNVWLGRYGTFDGTGLDEVVAAVDPALAATTTADLQASVDKLKVLVDLQNAQKPIDVIIGAAEGSPERGAMLAAIQALKKVAEDVEKAAAKLGLKVEFEEPSETL